MRTKPVLIGALLLAGLFLEGPARAAEAQRPPCWYKIRRGDELGKISRRFYGSVVYWREIQKANPEINPRKLKIGKKIWIPRLGEATPRPGTQTRPRPQPRPRPRSQPQPRPRSQPQPQPRPQPTKASPADGDARGVRRLFAWFTAGRWWQVALRIAAVYAFLSVWLWVASRMLRRVLGLHHTGPSAALFGGFLCLLAGMLIGYGVQVLMEGVFGVSGSPLAMSIIWGMLFLIAWSVIASLLLGHNYGVSPVAGAVTFVFWFALWAFAGGALLVVMVLLRATPAT